MPIDQMFLGPMLDTFKNMAADCTEKGYSGENYDTMMAALTRMETLGQDMDDFMAFSAQMTTEGLQMAFSVAYGKVLGEAAQATSSSSGAYDDHALLNQTLGALRNVISELKKAENAAITEAISQGANPEMVTNEIETLAKTKALIAPIEALIEYGESGINFPTFLRVQIEKGLDKAIEGNALLREGLEYDLSFAKASAVNPFDIQLKEEQIALFDTLAAKSAHEFPNSLSLNLGFDKIAHHFVPVQAKWKAIETSWERLFSLLDTWIIAHTQFAPHIEPWVMASNPRAAVEKDKETLPGIIKQHIRLLKENYGIDFTQIRTAETFLWSIKNHHFSYSQTYTNFIMESVLPYCLPGQFMDAASIEMAEKLYSNHEMSNPEEYKVLDRQETVYNSFFGENSFVQKFGPKPSFGQRTASAWKLD